MEIIGITALEKDVNQTETVLLKGGKKDESGSG